LNLLRNVRRLVSVALFATTTSCWSQLVISRDQVLSDARKTAQAQLAQIKGGVPVPDPPRKGDNPRIDWVAAVMWAGFADFARFTGDRDCAAAVLEMGRKEHWTPILHPKLPYHADDFAIGQSFLEAWSQSPDPAIIAPIRRRADAFADFILNQEQPAQLTWSWCDTLFMAPSVLARLSVITHDPRYLAAADKEWGKTEDFLYDKRQHLFFRDKRYFQRRTKNGQPVFWSRGNGWVLAGIARLLPYVPSTDPARFRYIQTFQEMAARLASLQQPDGTWRTSLLDPAEYPDSEFSGTALDCYGMAWGINNHLLNAKSYLPIVSRAWAGMLAARRPDGLPGYVQIVAQAPGIVRAGDTRLYSTGAFLLAAIEVSKLAPFPAAQVAPLSGD